VFSGLYVKSEVRHFVDNGNKMAAVNGMIIMASLKAIDTTYTATESGYRRRDKQL